MSNISYISDLTPREKDVLCLLATGMSDREIADELVLTVGTVKWYNRQIYNKLNVSNRTEAVTVVHQHNVLDVTESRTQAIQLLNTKLPQSQLTSFIGRKQEIRTLKKLLHNEKRLITLTGPPGVGKTRLAQELIREVSDEYDHVYFISLVGMSQAHDLLFSLNKTLGLATVSSQDALQILQTYLENKPVIFLLDNFEHLLAIAPVIAHLLAQCPSLALIITSREALNIYGEVEYAVAPLPSPRLGMITAYEAMLTYDSVRLFIERAQSNNPRFEINDENINAVAMICTHLDGLPLAIELAAARVKYFPPQNLMFRLTSRLDLLTDGPRDFPARQRTLRATIQWSYNLLEENEKTLFAYLAVFPASFTLEAVEALCRENRLESYLDVLLSLVDKNLLYREIQPDNSVRFHMLQTIQEYACEQLQKLKVQRYIHESFANYQIEFVQHITSKLYAGDHLYWVGLLEIERSNLQAALDWSLHSKNYVYGIQLVGALTKFWQLNGYRVAGLRWVNSLLPHLTSIDSTLHSAFLICAGLMYEQEDKTKSISLLEQAVKVAQSVGNTRDEADAKIHLGYIMLDSQQAEEGLRLAQELDDSICISTGHNVLGEIARFQGDHHAAQAAYQACLENARATNEFYYVDVAETNLTFIDQHFGNHKQAIERMKRVARMNCQLNSLGCLAQQFLIIAISYAELGETQKAMCLTGFGESIMKRIGSTFNLVDSKAVLPHVEALRVRYNCEAHTTAYHSGTHLPLVQAYIEAFGQPDDQSRHLLETYFNKWLN